MTGLEPRRATRQIRVRDVLIGGLAPVVVQGMTKSDTRDLPTVCRELHEMVELGCELGRVAVPDLEAAHALTQIKQRVRIPLVADIHFDPRLALAAIQAGADKLRINPGNIGGRAGLRAVVQLARERDIPIRVGVNGGSLEKHLLVKHGGPTPQALVESALAHCRLLGDEGLSAVVVSVKSSSVLDTIKAYRLLAQVSDVPLHLGVTEAGTLLRGTVKSSVGMGLLLAEGIGDTLRVSLAAPAAEEIRVAYYLLAALGLRQRGVEVVACPTCGRCQVDIRPLAQELEERLAHIRQPLTVAVMGCPVNGPGEAKHAHVGIACGKHKAVLFASGKVIETVRAEDIVTALVGQVEMMIKQSS